MKIPILVFSPCCPFLDANSALVDSDQFWLNIPNILLGNLRESCQVIDNLIILLGKVFIFRSEKLEDLRLKFHYIC